MGMIYDIATMVGAIILIFLLIFLTVDFGTKMTADMLNSAPLLIQDTLAAHLTTASIATGNAKISFEPKIPFPLIITLSKDTIFVEPKEKKYYSYTEVERGGVELKTPEPIEYVKLEGIIVSETEPENPIKFTEYNKKIIVSKTDKLSIDVK